MPFGRNYLAEPHDFVINQMNLLFFAGEFLYHVRIQKSKEEKTYEYSIQQFYLEHFVIACRRCRCSGTSECQGRRAAPQRLSGKTDHKTEGLIVKPKQIITVKHIITVKKPVPAAAQQSQPEQVFSVSLHTLEAEPLITGKPRVFSYKTDVQQDEICALLLHTVPVKNRSKKSSI